MSNHKSAIYVGTAEAKPFGSALRPVEFAVTSLGRGKESAGERLETAILEAREAGRCEGFQQGQEQGFAAGYEDGRREASQQLLREGRQAILDEMNQFVRELNGVTENVQTAVAHWFEEAERQMTELSLCAVKKLLAVELETSRESALHIARQALAQITHSRSVRIRVNPFDSILLRERKQELLSASENLRDVEVVSDSSIAAGCVVESDGGVVDATLDTRVILMEESIRRAA